MSTQLQLRRGTTAQHSTFTGASGEITIDTDKKTVVVHDGTTAGGRALPQFDSSGNLGIGTSSPSYKLDVTGSANAWAGHFLGSYTSGQSYGLSVDAGTNSSDTAFQIRNYSGSATYMKVTGDGNLLVGKTSATSNGGDVQVSKGITFPATQVACSDVNTLDDYEEGTWTPVLRGAGTAGTYNIAIDSNGAQYTKIGRLVTVNCAFTILAAGYSSGTGYAQVTGMPFANVGVYSGSCYFAGVDVSSDCLWCDVEFVSSNSQTTVYFNTIRDANSSVDTLVSGFDPGDTVRFTLTYTTTG